MNSVNNLRIRCVLAVMLTAVLGYGIPSIAADDPPDRTDTFQKGLACPSFDLQIEQWFGKRHNTAFTDKKGIVRTISAGTGSALKYTNLSTSGTFSSKSNGAVARTTVKLDGSSILEFTGHNVVILFPTDIPAGPSTTLYDGGRVVIAIDVNGNFTLQEESGKKLDICAILTP